ncbi:nucleotidyl transferase AbiEii/AbiGii toxin family protein [Patescibacteria group bacterium]|nr:nucleotidyl transferase AbiEii/AbiGii toxin family protein [Patescibacteria group bacterium]MBU1472770.1 nucleotidyl transferase AbiEii/AbiGii toxin family protein [Patescibacteria group bacterium]MBU2460036.1 nucleotidyl transferase AbiEii/AbiGii toxin family protein [Patescibacteria group bacterium]MBU2544306.1 nucleotidyl transferase AbiEii/AbiGii toxin family protein [Patescibacteria group bacterium]
MDYSHKPVKLSFTHLREETKKAFEILSQQTWIKDQGWYLAGGTALALQTDHRVSVDLDFFIPKPEIDVPSLISSLSKYNWAISLREKGTLYGILEETKISFIAYPQFIPLQPFITDNMINILDARDIAVMKIIAVSQRGTKRDFFDLYWYTKNKEPLADVIKRIDFQYPKIQHNYHHIMKSLTYFDDAEEDPDPQILFEASWEQVKHYFLTTVPAVANKILS